MRCRASMRVSILEKSQPHGAGAGKVLILVGHCCAWDFTYVSSLQRS